MELIESGTVQLDELLLNIYFSLILEYDKYIQSLEKEGIYDVAFVCGRFCFFAGVTSILAKCGIRKTDSTVATAIRTVVILVFSWLIVFLIGAQSEISSIDGKTLVFLILSGAATGASWLCYFRALQIGDINKVVPIDKSSTVLTILLALIFLHEG